MTSSIFRFAIVLLLLVHSAIAQSSTNETDTDTTLASPSTSASTNATSTGDGALSTTSTNDTETGSSSTTFGLSTDEPMNITTTASIANRVSLSDSSVATVAVVSSVGGFVLIAVFAYLFCWCKKSAKSKGPDKDKVRGTKELDERERKEQYARLNVNKNNPLPSVLQMGMRVEEGVAEEGTNPYRHRVNHRITTTAQFNQHRKQISNGPLGDRELELSTLEQPAPDGESTAAVEVKPEAHTHRDGSRQSRPFISTEPQEQANRPLSVSSPELADGASPQPSNNIVSPPRIGSINPASHLQEGDNDSDYSQRSDSRPAEAKQRAGDNNFASADIPTLKPASAGSDSRHMEGHRIAAASVSARKLDNNDDQSSSRLPSLEAPSPLQGSLRHHALPSSANSQRPASSGTLSTSYNGPKRPPCCPYCGQLFSEAPPICDVSEGSHKVIFEEIKAAKAAKRALQEQLRAHNPEVIAAVTSALATHPHEGSALQETEKL